MRRTSLFKQVLGLVALVSAASSVVAPLATGSVPSAGTLAAIAILTAATAVVLTLVALNSRFSALEALVEDMERVDLSMPGSNLPSSIDGTAEAEEVERLELSFLRMMRRLEAERHRAASSALHAQERERARVARDLHDEVNQSLTGLLLRLEALRDEAPAGLTVQIDELKKLANQAMAELLALARQLRPTLLDDLGLRAALEELVEQAGGGTDVSTEVSWSEGVDDGALNDEVQLVVYRVAQEALANAVRHSGARTIRVAVTTGDDGVSLQVTDDGSGFSFSEAGDGLGLEGMRERALLVGGTLETESRPDHGTAVNLHVPGPSAPELNAPGS